MLGERLDDAPAGVVDQDIELAEAFDREIDGRLRDRVLGQVAGVAFHLHPALGDQLVLRRFQRRGVEIGEHEVGAVARETIGDGIADALGGAGDDSNAVFKRFRHVSSLTE